MGGDEGSSHGVSELSKLLARNQTFPKTCMEMSCHASDGRCHSLLGEFYILDLGPVFRSSGPRISHLPRRDDVGQVEQMQDLRDTFRLPTW
jgi:hypothetical protein